MTGAATVLEKCCRGDCTMQLNGTGIATEEDLALVLTKEEVIRGEEVMEEEFLFAHTTVLASDEFGGRFPGTLHERLATDYLVSKAKELGLSPGNPNTNDFLQQVPLVKAEATNVSPLLVSSSSSSSTDSCIDPAPLTFHSPKDFTAFSSISSTSLNLEESEVVFLGYGVKASQWNWDDYSRGVDVRGKTVFVLVNDPGLAEGDATFFNGKCMTYYGRWPYKFEEAGRQGATACFIIHNTVAASYPWHVLENGRGSQGRSYYMLEKHHHHSQCLVEGWVTEDLAKKVFKKAGFDFEVEKAKASKHNFQPFSLGQKLSVRVTQSIERLVSHNVVARIPGTDPELSQDHIIFTAHWDHMGKEGENIFRGARDNALGCASLLELARAFLTLPTKKRRRSVLFLFTTCEEQVLLGSLFYVANPLWPLRHAVACLNVDVMNTWGQTRDMSYSGKGFTDLDECIEKAAQRQGRIIKGEYTPETGMFYRSDHFPFAKNGVPAIYLKNGFNHVKKGEEWFCNLYKEWVVECYHKPEDRVVRDPTSKWCWDLSGCLEDTRLLFDVACQLIDKPQPVHWKDGIPTAAEFKHIRTLHLKGSLHG